MNYLEKTLTKIAELERTLSVQVGSIGQGAPIAHDPDLTLGDEAYKTLLKHRPALAKRFKQRDNGLGYVIMSPAEQKLVYLEDRVRQLENQLCGAKQASPFDKMSGTLVKGY